MSYYVTLPSNGADITSDHEKEHNTQTVFETDLKVPLELHQNFRVGLAEVCFKKLWLVNIGKFIPTDNITKKIVTEVEIEVIGGIPINKLLALISTKINDNRKTDNLT